MKKLLFLALGVILTLILWVSCSSEQPAAKFEKQAQASETLASIPAPVMLALIDMSTEGQPVDSTNNIFHIMEDSVIVKYTYPAAGILAFAEILKSQPDCPKVDDSPIIWANFLYAQGVVANPDVFFSFYRRYAPPQNP